MNNKGLSHLPEYHIWNCMKYRCYKPTDVSYKNYGGRGILVCDRWLIYFSNFLDDMGRRPSSKHTLDRINNNGNYCKENCKWTATRKEQNDNRRIAIWLEMDGKRMVLKDWAKLWGMAEHTLRMRLKRYTMEEALSRPKFKMPHEVLIEYNGVNMNIKDWSKKLGLSPELLGDRLRRWKDVNKSFETPVRKQ